MTEEEEKGSEEYPPGWHADPWGQAGLRWWDGREWTGYVWPPAGTPGPKRTDGLAIAALVCGLVGFFPLAIGFGVVARRRIARSEDVEGAGLATAGIVLGAITIAVIALFVVLGLTGALDESTNAEGYRGEERRVAAAVDRFEQYADDERFTQICDELFTEDWAEAVADGGGGSCEKVFEDEVGGRIQAEIDIENIVIRGSRAEVLADEAGDELEVSLVQENGDWKIQRFR